MEESNSAHAGNLPAARWGPAETLMLVWVVIALAALPAAALLLQGAFPVFTVLWLILPLVVVLRTHDARRVGVRPVPRGALLWVTAANLGAWLLLMALVEPWSGTYRLLLQEVLANPRPDTTFAWLVRFPGWPGWGGMFLYSGLVTLFGEELFFRGWLLQLLLRRFGKPWAIGIQAGLFTLPQVLAAFLFPPPQAVLWVVVYSWLAAGVTSGWAAARTGSIWPGLISATVCNLLLSLFALHA
jgi:membrane protease YdiL (CAAX protease family)